jgi:hypothetical protein
MRRPFVISTGALALALLPAALSAQTPPPAPAQQPPAQQPPAQQPPAQQPPAQQPPAQAATATPKLAFTSPAGTLLVPIKPDQTAVFEEFAKKLAAGFAKTEDATLKQQAAGLKIYKAAEPFGPNALFVIMVEPTVPNAEYDLFAMLQKTMTPEEQRAPETAEMWKRFTAMFASAPSRLSLTPAAK